MHIVKRSSVVSNECITWSPAVQKMSLTACREDELDSDSFLAAGEASSSSPVLDSFPNTHDFMTEKQSPRPTETSAVCQESGLTSTFCKLSVSEHRSCCYSNAYIKYCVDDFKLCSGRNTNVLLNWERMKNGNENQNYDRFDASNLIVIV